jgi:hypothetical protein
MARLLFGGTAADAAEDASGVRVPGATGTVWDGASEGATEVTDLTDLTGAPIAGLVADDNGMIPSFYGPEAGPERLYVDFGGGKVAIVAVDVGDRLKTHVTAFDPHGDRTAVLDEVEAQKGSPNGLATLDADGLVSLPQLPGALDWISVKARHYGAKGDGVTDDTAAIQAAVDDAKAAGTAVYIPAGTYLVSAPISLPPGDGLTIQGAGWGSVLKVKGGANCYIFRMTGADTRVTIRDMKLDGNCLEQNAASGGIYGAGAVTCLFENIHFTFCWEDALFLGPMTGGAFGHNNKIISCLFDQSMASTGPGRGIYMMSSDENQITACDFEFLGGMGGSGFESAVCILDRAGTQMITSCNFVGGAANNTKGVRLQDSANTKLIGCNFDGLAGDSIFVAGTQNLIVGNTIFSPGEVGTAGQASGIHLEYGTARNLIQGNTLASSPTDGRSRSLIREEAMGDAGPNQITGNVLVTKGKLAAGLTEIEGAGTVFRNNLGTPGATVPQSNGYYVPEGWGRFWRAKRDAAGTSSARVLVIGSAISQGLFATNLETNGWVGVMRSALQARYGSGGSGFYPTSRSSTYLATVGVGAPALDAWTARNCLVVQTGTWTVGSQNYGPGATHLTATAAGSLTFKATGSTVRIYTLTGAGTRAGFTYKIDAGATVPVADAGGPAVAVQTTTVSGLSTGEHTVTVSWAGSTSQTLSVMGVSGELPTGVIVHNLSKSGAKAVNYADPTPAALNAVWNGGSAYSGDLIIVMAAPADASSGTSPDAWAVSVSKHLSAVKEANQGATDVLLVLPHIGKADETNYVYQGYASRARGLAEAYGAALVDLWTIGRNSYDYWASLNYWVNTAVPGQPGTDSVHPSDLGHVHIANTILPVLTA